MSETIKAEPTTRIQWAHSAPQYLPTTQALKVLEDWGYVQVGEAVVGELFGEVVTVRHWARHIEGDTYARVMTHSSLT